MLDAVITYLWEHPLMLFAILFFLYNKWKASQPCALSPSPHRQSPLHRAGDT